MILRLRLFLMMILFICISSFAQQQSLKLSGKVINIKNEPISGVSVKIVGAGGTSTNIEGRYSLSLLTDKKYEIEFSTIGYTSKLVNDIIVGKDLDNELNVVLEIITKSLEGVTVKASSRRQENTNALLTFQRTNTALSSGLAADFIRRTPDKNTGEVLKRVSGASIQDNKFVIVRGLSDRYNAALINNAQLPSTEPDRKAFSFDIIPATLIDNIIINKTATPELPGEFAGGLVQINTKDVPTKNFFSVGFSFGFNTQSAFKDFFSNERNKTDWIGFDDGTRSLPKEFPSTAQNYRALGNSTAGVNEQIALSKLFKNEVYREKSTTALPIQTYNITWGSSFKTKNNATWGAILALQYRNSMLKYDVERQLNEQNGTAVVQLSDKQNKYATNVGAIANISYLKGRHKISFKNLFNQLFEDNYYQRVGVSTDRIQDINFRSSVLNQRSLYSGQLEGEHQLTSGGIRFRWNGNAAYNEKYQPDLRTSAYFRSKGSTDPLEHNDDDTRRFFSNLKDYSYGANAVLTIPIGGLTGNKQTFKAGGSTIIRIRDFKSRIMRYEPTSIQFDADKNYLPYNEIFASENISKEGFKILDFTNNQDKYFAISTLNGLFGMFDSKIGEALRLVWGVRVENFQQFLTTKDVTAKRIVNNTEKWDILPSLNATISPNQKNSIRLSASRTVARPEFREIAPFSFFDYELNYAINGNPELKRTAIFNGDIRYEFYPKSGEAITLGGFYKYFTDPIELRLNSSSVLDRRNYEYTNAKNAYSIGAELEIRKGLDFVAEDLANFNVFTNITYIYSKVKLTSTSSTGSIINNSRPLQGQSPYLINVGLQYASKNNGWNSSLLYNRIGQRLALVGLNDLGFPDVYERPRDQVDFQLAKKVLAKKGEIKLTWADILNPAYYFYENGDTKNAFKKNADRLFYTYKTGSTVSIGFTYDFNLSNSK